MSGHPGQHAGLETFSFRAQKAKKLPDEKLKRGFYDRPTLRVARELVGMVLVDRRSSDKERSLRIVEVEAYIGEDDPACHAAPGPTLRNRIMYGRPGLAYVYLIYGMYNCLNIVTEKDGFPAAILIRAAEPLEGKLEISGKSGQVYRPDGPGKLCLALGIDRSDNGLDLTQNALYLADRDLRPETIAKSERVGISAATDRLWRFFDPDSRYISTQRKTRPQTVKTMTK